MPRPSISSDDTIKIKSQKSITSKFFGTLTNSIYNRPPPSLWEVKLSPLDRLSRLTFDDLKASKRIGAGGFGEVLLLEHPDVGKVALKRLHLSRSKEEADNQRRRALREGKIWSDFKHPYILPCLGILEAVGNLFLVSPFMPNGSLSSYIKAHPQAERIEWLIQIADALAFLHKSGIVHGDIKAANVLIGEDVEALLCDFGLSRSSSADTSIGLQGQGSVRWQSIELMENERGKTFMSDMWAFGMLIYEASASAAFLVLSGLLPFHAHATNTTVIYAVAVKRELPEEHPPRSPRGESYARAWAVARRCWDTLPQNRGTAEQALRELRLMTISYEFPGHLEDIKSAFISSDGRHVAVIGMSQPPQDDLRSFPRSMLSVVKLDNLENKDHVRRDSWADGITSVTFSPDGRTMACKYIDFVSFTDLASWTSSYTDICDPGESLAGGGVFFSPDGRRCLIRKSGHETYLVDVASGQALGCSNYHGALLGFSGDGTKLYYYHEVSGTWGDRWTPHSVRVESKTLDLANLQQPSTANILDITCTAPPRIWTSADTFVIWYPQSSVHRLQVYNLATGQFVWEMAESLQSIVLSPDGNVLLTRGEDGWNSLWNVKTGERCGRFKAPRFASVLLTNRAVAIVNELSYAVRVWDYMLYPDPSPLEPPGRQSSDGGSIRSMASDANSSAEAVVSI